MPDTQTDNSIDPSSPDIGSLVQTSIPKDVTEGLSKLERDKMASEDRATRDVTGQLGADSARVHKAYDAEGITPNDIKPWNEAEEKKKFETDPIQAFGSLGSVFGIVAAAFTHAPLENALNASAAAINAVKAGDDKEYERSHQAWKENMDLVMKRHQMMHEQYQDATELMKTNLAAGEAKLKMLASKFGDQKTLFLMEHGMLPDLWQMMDARNKAVEGAYKATHEITLDQTKDKFFKQEIEGIQKDVQNPIAQAALTRNAWEKYYGKQSTPPQEAYHQFVAEKIKETGKMPSSDEIVKFVQKSAPRYGAGTTGEVERRTEEYMNDPNSPTKGDRGASYDRASKEIAADKKAAPVLTKDRQRAASVSDYEASLKADKNADGTPKYTAKEIAVKGEHFRAELNTEGAGLTGNALDKLKSRRDQISFTKDDIEKAKGILRKHGFITGAGNFVGRPLESISSALGSNSTDWHEFESLVNQIKQRETRIALDAQTRPLASEREYADKVVRGMNWGDTHNISFQRFISLESDIDKYLKATDARMHPGEDAAAAPATPDANAPTDKWWEKPQYKPAAQ